MSPESEGGEVGAVKSTTSRSVTALLYGVVGVLIGVVGDRLVTNPEGRNAEGLFDELQLMVKESGEANKELWEARDQLRRAEDERRAAEVRFFGCEVDRLGETLDRVNAVQPEVLRVPEALDQK